jgi:hypothetical protein
MAAGGDESRSRSRAGENSVKGAGRGVNENRPALEKRTPRSADVFGREIERRHHSTHRIRGGRCGR